MAVSCLLTFVGKQQRACPDRVFVIVGDFNKANLKTVLLKVYKHVDRDTRGANILHRVYRNINHDFKGTPLPVDD